MSYNISEVFWKATLEEMKQGYIYNAEAEEFICLVCGIVFEKGIIYPKDNVFYEAEKYTKLHIQEEHGSMFEYLLNLDKKLTGITEHQKKILGFFYQGLSDQEIVRELDGGSTSTIRNHRFTLREKEKQAKIFLSLMELLADKDENRDKFVPIHRTATMVDDRYAITEDENSKVLKTYFKEGLDGPLSQFPLKQKRKLIILKHLIKRFEVNKKYTEKEVNLILKEAYNDFVTLRRYFIEYGFMDRNPDGSAYWVKA